MRTPTSMSRRRGKVVTALLLSLCLAVGDMSLPAAAHAANLGNDPCGVATCDDGVMVPDPGYTPPWIWSQLSNFGSSIKAEAHTDNWPTRGTISVRIIVYEETGSQLKIVIDKTNTCYNAWGCSVYAYTACICGAMYEMFAYGRGPGHPEISSYDWLQA